MEMISFASGDFAAVCHALATIATAPRDKRTRFMDASNRLRRTEDRPEPRLVEETTQRRQEVGRCVERMIAVDRRVRRVERVEVLMRLRRDLAHACDMRRGEEQILRIDVAGLHERLRLLRAAARVRL